MISSRTQNFLYSSKIKSQSTAAAHSTIRAIIAIAIVDIYKCFIVCIVRTERGSD
jgi:hypothetical protein